MGNEKESIGEYVDIDTLKEWEHNPRNNELAIAKVARSIERFGFASPVIAREEDNMVIAGHTRVLMVIATRAAAHAVLRVVRERSQSCAL